MTRRLIRGRIGLPCGSDQVWSEQPEPSAKRLAPEPEPEDNRLSSAPEPPLVELFRQLRAEHQEWDRVALRRAVWERRPEGATLLELYQAEAKR